MYMIYIHAHTHAYEEKGSEMTQLANVLTTNPEDLSSIPRIYTVENKNTPASNRCDKSVSKHTHIHSK